MDEKIVKDSQGLAKDLVNDCISRQAAIDAVYAEMPGLTFDGVLKILYTLSPAQPEIIRCRDCCYWIPGLITDNDCFIPPKCGKYQQLVGHFADDYCSYADHGEVSE